MDWYTWRAWPIISREIPAPLSCRKLNQWKPNHNYWNSTNFSTNKEDCLIGKRLWSTVLAGVRDSIRVPFRPFRKALNVWHIRRVASSSSNNDRIEILRYSSVIYSSWWISAQTCVVHFALVVLCEVFRTSFMVKVQPIRLPSSAYLFCADSTLVL